MSSLKCSIECQESPDGRPRPPSIQAQNMSGRGHPRGQVGANIECFKELKKV